MTLFVILTSYKEEITVGKAIEQIICPNKDLWPNLKLIITAPDNPTLKKAEEVCQSIGFDNFRLLQDAGQGKACALNLAVETITKEHAVTKEEDLLIFTDGDMYIADDAIKNLLKAIGNREHTAIEIDSLSNKQPKLGGVGGHPVSLDDRNTMFGYFSHLFCEAAHKRRLNKVNKNSTRFIATSGFVQNVLPSVLSNVIPKVICNVARPYTPMSGYLYAIRPVDGIFPIPPEIRAEDAYISQKLVDLGYTIAYAPNALAYVKFPKNLDDWFKQKTRSLGGNVQLLSIKSKSTTKPCKTRSIFQDLQMVLFPLFFARNFKEFIWSLALYPLRLLLWLKIYFNHAFSRYKSGMWERIESSK